VEVLEGVRRFERCGQRVEPRRRKHRILIDLTPEPIVEVTEYIVAVAAACVDDRLNSTWRFRARKT